MWIITPKCFVSIVEKPWDRAQGTLTVRARRLEDLEYWLEVGGSTAQVAIDRLADYPFRLQQPAHIVMHTAGRIASAIDYDNMKGAVSPFDKARHDAYVGCWSSLIGMETIDRPVPPGTPDQQPLFKDAPKPKRKRQRPRRRRR